MKATLSKDFLLCDKEIKLHEHNAQINPKVYRMFWLQQLQWSKFKIHVMIVK